MNLTKKFFGMMVLGVLSTVAASAQSPEAGLQNTTSTISVGNVDGYTVSQQVGSPLSMPSAEDTGDAALFQGLFCALTGVSSTESSGIDRIFADNERFAMVYDASAKSLTVRIPSGETVRVFVVDASGKTVASLTSVNELSTLNLSTLAPGLYMAGVAQNNNFSKTLKFVVK